jgi:hypothetical protein
MELYFVTRVFDFAREFQTSREPTAHKRFLNIVRTANALQQNDLRCVAKNHGKQNSINIERQSVLSSDSDQRTFKMPPSYSRFFDLYGFARHPQRSTLNPQPSFAFSEFRCKRRP